LLAYFFNSNRKRQEKAKGGCCFSAFVESNVKTEKERKNLDRGIVSARLKRKRKEKKNKRSFLTLLALCLSHHLSYV